MKRQHGWTWIETLIVIAILGILAAVIVPNVRYFMHRNDAIATGSQPSIDRAIAGTVVTIDRAGNYSTLHFSDGTTCLVTNESLDHFTHLVNATYVYELHRIYDVHAPFGTPYEIIRIH